MRPSSKTFLSAAFSVLFLTASSLALADPIPAPSCQAAIDQFMALGKSKTPRYKVKSETKVNPALAKKAALRSYVKDQRRKLYSHRKVTRTSKPAMSRQAIEAMLTQLSAKRAGLGTGAPRSVNARPRGIPSSFIDNPLDLVFAPADYTPGLNQLFYAYNGFSNDNSIAVDFNYVDLEPNDYVELYDTNGLCASYTGNLSAFVSEVCQGPNIEVWIYTDVNSSGGASYNGFEINGFYTSSEQTPNTTPSGYPVAVAAADHYTVTVGQTVFFDGRGSYDTQNLDGTLWYQWSFGDGTYDPTVGTSAAESTTTNTYFTPGTYTVTLTVTNAAGFSATDSFPVTVQQTPPTAQFSLKASPVYIVNPAVIYPVDGNRADSLNVDWGDGSSQFFSPYIQPSGGFSHLYSAVGTYLITVTADNSAGEDIAYTSVAVSDQQIPPVVQLLNQGTLDGMQGRGYSATYNLAVSSDGQIAGVDVNWAGPTPEQALQHLSPTDLAAFQSNGGYNFLLKHNYTAFVNGKKKSIAGVYDTTITATDNVGERTTVDYRFATKNLPPVVSKAIGAKCSGMSCTLGYNGKQPITKLIYDKDGTIVDFFFEVYRGDHTNLAMECPRAQDQQQFTCTFSEAGTYYLHLRATDNLGATTDVWKPIKVKGAITKLTPLSETGGKTPPAENGEF